LNKKAIYGSERCDDDEESDDYDSRKRDQGPMIPIWSKPIDDEVKLIDFGGATYEDEHHTTIINTR
jgi:hypothetical protein